MLFVGKGKGGEALEPLKKRLRRRAGQIRAVCIDMSSAYAAWVENVLPQADIVYDHFHLIKLMNERMDGLRAVSGRNSPRNSTPNKQGNGFR